MDYTVGSTAPVVATEVQNSVFVAAFPRKYREP